MGAVDRKSDTPVGFSYGRKAERKPILSRLGRRESLILLAHQDREAEVFAADLPPGVWREIGQQPLAGWRAEAFRCRFDRATISAPGRECEGAKGFSGTVSYKTRFPWHSPRLTPS